MTRPAPADAGEPVRQQELPRSLGDFLRHLGWARRLCRRHAANILRALVANATISLVVPAALALSIRGLIDAVAAGMVGEAPNPSSSRDLLFWLLVGLAASVIGVVTGSVHMYLTRRLQVELRDRLQFSILEHNAGMSTAQLEDRHYQDALQRALPNPEVHVGNIVVYTIDLLVKAVQATSLVVILAAIEPLLFLLLLPIGVPYLIYQLRLSRRHFLELDERVEKSRWIGYYTGLLGSGESAAELRLLGVQPLLLQRCRAVMREFRGLLLRYQRQEFVGNLLFAVLSVVAVYVALSKAALTIRSGQSSLGDLAIFASAAAQLRGLVDGIVGQLVALRWQVFNVANLSAYLAIEPEAPLARATASAANHAAEPRDVATPLRGDLRLDGVAFSYPGATRPAVENVSFSVAAGETVALVGENGAGKSTVAKIIAGLYRPSRGRVLFDGVDRTEMASDRVAGHVACVFQNYIRFAATAGDNIAFGDWRRLVDDPQGVAQIAQRAGVADLLASLPEGADTMLGREFGEAQLSGGQWQQLVVARAAAGRAGIVILDEPTSNIDPPSEARLFEHFLDLTRGKTRLLISHRFSTVRRADRIVVFAEGRVVEDGTHEQLVALGGRYAKLYDP